MTSPTIPVAGSVLDGESVKLLQKGDLCRDMTGQVYSIVMEANDKYVAPVQVVGAKSPRLFMVFGDTFIGRPDQDGWIKHIGDVNPVGDIQVEALLKSGDVLFDDAVSLLWDQNDDIDVVIAFRPHRKVSEGHISFPQEAEIPTEQTDEPAGHILTEDGLRGRIYPGVGPWACFHCGYVAETREDGLLHFGRAEDCTPICGVAAETYRTMEQSVWEYRNECDAASKTFYSLGAEHQTKLREAEQAGYDKGLADGSALSHPVAAEGQVSGQWQPIETAPKDGTRIILFSVPNELPSLRPHIADGYWKETSGFMAPGLWMLGQSVGPSFSPTHWMPLSLPHEQEEAASTCGMEAEGRNKPQPLSPTPSEGGVEPQPVACWQRRPAHEYRSATVSGTPWAQCSREEATDVCKRHPSFEYRPLYAPPTHQASDVSGLVEALAELQDVFAREGEGSLERFERLAEMFRKDTGYLAPGKDPGMCSRQPDGYELRRIYDDWFNAKVVRAREALAQAQQAKP